VLSAKSISGQASSCFYWDFKFFVRCKKFFELGVAPLRESPYNPRSPAARPTKLRRRMLPEAPAERGALFDNCIDLKGYAGGLAVSTV
jgi:hypothetical protein